MRVVDPPQVWTRRDITHAVWYCGCWSETTSIDGLVYHWTIKACGHENCSRRETHEEARAASQQYALFQGNQSEAS